MKLRLTTALLTALLCTSCAGIDVAKYDPGKKTQTGTPWNLAMTQYKITITRQITNCGSFKGVVVVAATPTKALDPTQQYVLDGKGWWATSDITSTLASDGTSTGLNAHSENAASAAIASVVSLAATTAPLPGNEIKGVRTPVVKCKKDVGNAIADLNRPYSASSKKRLKDVVADDTQALADASAKVATLTVQANLDKSYKPALARAIGTQAGAQNKLNLDQARLTKDLQAVQDVQTVLWPVDPAKIRTDQPFRLSKAVVDKWVTYQQQDLPNGPDISGFDVSFALYAEDGKGGWAPPKWSLAQAKQPASGPPTGDVSIGVPVRLPAIGRLYACVGKVPACPGDTSVNAKLGRGVSIAVTPDQPVLQFGPMYNVRVAGGVFKSEAAVIALDSNGLPTSIETGEKTAAATAALGAATQVAAIPKQIAAYRLAETQAQTAQINASNALITAQASAATANATATAKAQSALLTARANLATAQVNAQSAGSAAANDAAIALINQQNTLATLQSNAAVTPEVDALQTQTILINAQATSVNAQVALQKAQAALTQ